jgi:hypothetical protein
MLVILTVIVIVIVIVVMVIIVMVVIVISIVLFGIVLLPLQKHITVGFGVPFNCQGLSFACLCLEPGRLV